MHAAGVAHADLKRKANIIVGPGERPWLIDFGIAARRGTSALGRSWFEHAVQGDYNAWIKLKYGRRIEPAEAAERAVGRGRGALPTALDGARRARDSRAVADDHATAAAPALARQTQQVGEGRAVDGLHPLTRAQELFFWRLAHNAGSRRTHRYSSGGWESARGAAATRPPRFGAEAALNERRRSLSAITIFSTSACTVCRSPRRYPLMTLSPWPMRYSSQSRPALSRGALDARIDSRRNAKCFEVARRGRGFGRVFQAQDARPAHVAQQTRFTCPPMAPLRGLCTQISSGRRNWQD